MNYKTRLIIIVLVLVLCVVPLKVALGQGGFASWFSINMTAVSDSYLDVDMSGEADSHLTLAFSGLFAPTNLLLTLLGIDSVQITWTKGIGAENTMVRAAIGHVPVDRTDGYLVYYGTDTSATDYVDLGQQIVWYRAWSQSAAEAWEADGIWDSIGGNMYVFLLFGILGLGLTFGFIWKKYGWLSYGAAGVWGLLGFLALQTSSSANPGQITDVYMGLFWLCMGFVIACSLLPSVMREKPSKDDIYVDEIDEVTGERIPKEEPKRKRTRPSLFSRRGE